MTFPNRLAMRAHKITTWFSNICESQTARTLIPAVAGFLGYGSWGYFCNMGYGWEMGVQSGLVQGSLSFIITLVFNGVMESIYKASASKAWSTVITIMGLVLVSFTINTLAGTPEVIATIAPGSIIGSFYVHSYISNLAAVAKRNGDSDSNPQP